MKSDAGNDIEGTNLGYSHFKCGGTVMMTAASELRLEEFWAHCVFLSEFDYL